ncbi:MAG: HAMP domain-containing sensor histidine kinase, partial [Planctomycetota bacterium]
NLALQKLLDISNQKPILDKNVSDAYKFEFVLQDNDSAFEAYKNITESAADEEMIYSSILGQARVKSKSNSMSEALFLYQKAATAGTIRDENGLLIAPAAQFQILSLTSRAGMIREYCTAFLKMLKMIVTDRKYFSREEVIFYDEIISSYLKQALTWTKTLQETENKLITELDKLLQEHRLIQEKENFCVFLTKNILPEMLRAANSVNSKILKGEDNNKERLVLFCGVGGSDAKEPKWHGFAGFEVNKKAFIEKYISAELSRIGPSGELLITVKDKNNKALFGGEDIVNLYEISTFPFPLPFDDISAVALLRGYQSLDALAGIKTKIYVWAIVLSIAGVAAGVVLTYFVVSRQIRIARQKSDFVSNVTHELKTPLTSIQMFAETLSEGRVRDKTEASQCVDIIIKESKRLSNLIEKVLDFGRIEQGKKVYRLGLCNSYDMIHETLNSFNSQLKTGSPCIVYSNIPKSLPVIYADKEAIQEAVINLLSNAYKYTLDGDKKIWVNASETGKEIRIEIIDKGIGIPTSECKAIFKKFYRVDDSLTRTVDGTGLGLTISSHIARAHKGRIEIESKIGEGSKFTLVIAKQTSKTETAIEEDSDS